ATVVSIAALPPFAGEDVVRQSDPGEAGFCGGEVRIGGEQCSWVEREHHASGAYRRLARGCSLEQPAPGA
ncbi:MAG TPA: hypothetical protein VK356_09780, partial [Thermomicrobiales bacterium]|nr:hypothetical protein [Thermomicrobiales bacterium]